MRHLLSRRRAIRVRRLRRGSRLLQELGLDLLDLVDIILTLKSYFHITIPDEVPLLTVGDLVDFVGAETGFDKAGYAGRQNSLVVR